MTCDAKFHITSCVAKWPGSVHDSRIFRDSQLCSSFENGQLWFLILMINKAKLSLNNQDNIHWNVKMNNLVISIYETNYIW